MITKVEMKNKVEEFIKLNHIDSLEDASNEEKLWWVIENKLTEEEQQMIVYRMFIEDVVREEDDVTDTLQLFGVTRHQFGARINKIRTKIAEEWEQ